MANQSEAAVSGRVECLVDGLIKNRKRARGSWGTASELAFISRRNRVQRYQ